MATIGEIGEAALIRIFAGGGAPPGPAVLAPNGDDAFAYLPSPGDAVVVTTDSLVERVHFVLDGPPRLCSRPEEVGRKLMRVNLSDLAAMGSTPESALLSVHAPLTLPVAVAEDLARGIFVEAAAHGVAIAGGNVSRTDGPLVLVATLLGRARPGELLLKSGAAAGDALFVTGTLGEARAGLLLAQDPRELSTLGIAPADAEQVLSRLKLGHEAVRAGLALAPAGLVHAAADISDGLGRDLRRMLEPGGLGASITRATVPVSAAAARVAAALGQDPVELALEGGEDYELLLAVPSQRAAELQAVLAAVSVPCARIGAVVAGGRFVLDAGAPLVTGFDHFAG